MAVKIGIYSDLHLEMNPYREGHKDYRIDRDVDEGIRSDGADIRVFAGDIAVGKEAADWLLSQKGVEIVYVAGNHELYGESFESYHREMREIFRGTRVHFLEKESLVIDSIKFLGATLWCDYRLNGTTLEVASKLKAYSAIRDFQSIKLRVNSTSSYATPDIYQREFARTVTWLDEGLANAYTGKTVVVTHYAPSELSIPARFKGSLLSSSFGSSLDNLIEFHRPELWIHGHLHDSADYMIGDTRVICNPRGYPWNSDLNECFKGSLIVNI